MSLTSKKKPSCLILCPISSVAYYSLYSTAVPMFDGANVSNFMAAPMFSAGVVATDGLGIRPSSYGGAFPAHTEPCMTRSVSVHRCSEMLSQSSTLAPADEKLDGAKDAATNISHAVSGSHMATQMSLEGSIHSSPKTELCFPNSTPPILPINELQSDPACKLEVRDVQVDKRVTMTRWSKKHKARIPGKGSKIFDSWKKKDPEVRSPAWDLSDTTKGISKVKREEAKITACENMQKAKVRLQYRSLRLSRMNCPNESKIEQRMVVSH